APPLDEQDWHSPSFDREGKRLTFVSNCKGKACSAVAKGSHIAVLDIETKEFRQISNGKQEIEVVSFSYVKKEPLRLSPPGYSGKIVRGTPVFSLDGDRIYYMAGTGSGSDIFWQQFNDFSWLNVLDLTAASSSYAASDKLVQKLDQSAVMYKGGGRIAVIGEDRLIFSGGNTLGLHYRGVNAYHPSAFFYDVTKEKLGLALSAKNLPVDPRFPVDSFYVTRILTASNDGQKIAFIRGFSDIVSIIESGKFRDIISASDLGLEAINYIALSGDGKTLVITPPFVSAPPLISTDQDTFWVMNMDSGSIKKLPLRSLLRKAIENRQPVERI
ncbi:MAG: hypothetical protein V7727_18370, partial [Sneathiella sp.]